MSPRNQSSIMLDNFARIVKECQGEVDPAVRKAALEAKSIKPKKPCEKCGGVGIMPYGIKCDKCKGKEAKA